MGSRMAMSTSSGVSSSDANFILAQWLASLMGGCKCKTARALALLICALAHPVTCMIVLQASGALWAPLACWGCARAFELAVSAATGPFRPAARSLAALFSLGRDRGPPVHPPPARAIVTPSSCSLHQLDCRPATLPYLSQGCRQTLALRSRPQACPAS